MCCGSDGYVEPFSSCRECGGDVDSDGFSVEQCFYSPVSCDACESRPCDGSC